MTIPEHIAILDVLIKAKREDIALRKNKVELEEIDLNNQIKKIDQFKEQIKQDKE